MKSKGGNILILNEPLTQEDNIETSTTTDSNIDQKCCTTAANDQTIADELVFSLTMLITEGRKPDSNSSRGYKEGIHIINNKKSNNHQCSLKSNECRIAHQIKTELSKCIENNNKIISNATKTIYTSSSTSLVPNINSQALKLPTFVTNKRTQSLSPSPSPTRSSSTSSSLLNNNCLIGIVLDVCLVADCCYDIIKGDLIQSKSLISYELLERWNINIMPNNKSDNKLTFNELFQAIRSYLHFSQISSWLNQNKGQSPKTVAYSICCSQNTQSSTHHMNEYFDIESSANDEDYLDLKNNYDLQTFPSINIICGSNHLYNLTVNLQAKKRKNSLIPPYIYCNNSNKCCLNKYSTPASSPPNENYAKKYLPFYEPSPPSNMSEVLKVDENEEEKKKSTPITSSNVLFKLNYDDDNDYGHNIKLKTSISSSPVPGDRRRLSLDDAKQPISKCLKLNNSSPYDKLSGVFKNNNKNNNSEEDDIISRINSSRTLNLIPKRFKIPNINFDDKKNSLLLTPVSTPPKDNNNNNNLLRPVSPPTPNLSSPFIILSKNENKFFNESSKLLITELCTSTQNQLNLADNNSSNHEHLFDEPLTCFINNKQQTHDDDDDRIKFQFDNDEDLFTRNEKTEQELSPLEKLVLHYIRSPTDGVCLPIFKNHQDTNELIDSNNECNGRLIANENITKRSQRCIKTFHKKSGLPLSSSPAPMRKSGSAFNFDKSLKNPKSIKNALSLNMINSSVEDEEDAEDQKNKPLFYRYRSYNQASSCRLLGTFEESLLNGRMNPMGIVEGFYAQIGASGSFFPEHATLPVQAAFYHVCEDIAASPYLGLINLAEIGRRGYKVPNKGTIQVTLFNPNNTVVKMFVVMYDLSDMPANHRTFLRQRTMYVPLPAASSSDENNNYLVNGLKSYLRYSIHLRFATSKSGKLYLHTNIKLIFARNKCEIDPRLAKYEYKTFTEAPKAPKYSLRK